MPSASPTSRPSASSSRRAVLLGGLVLVAAVILAYANSLRGSFVYDDRPSIVFNPTIRDLSDWRAILHPPAGGITVSGRPVLNVSFALNYALGGLSERSFHVGNVAIHAALALTLFGLIARTLRLWSVAPRLRERALPLALGAALVWSLHPLQTEAVTYLVQRAESLMSLCFAFMLYAFVRSTDSPRPRVWQFAAWAACLLGMGTKENMAAAPLIVLLYDRTFLSGSFAAAWRRGARFYAALASTWVFLAALVVANGANRGGSAGFDVGVEAPAYWLTQIPALWRYVALTFWPHPLVFDYGPFHVASVTAVLLPGLVLAAAIAAILVACVRWPQAGFAGITALAILAPTSLVPGTTQMIVEHRMYLPLAAVLAGLLPFAARLGSRAFALSAAAIALAFGLTTAARNRVYQSELALWSDTVAKRPDNPVARSSLGAALNQAGRRDAALAEHYAALRLSPHYAPALANLGIALVEAGKPTEALPYLTHAVDVDPRNAQAHLNLGVALDLLHRPAEALPQHAAAADLMPLLPQAQNNYGDALARAGQLEEGRRHLERALALDPTYPDAHFNLAAALARQGRLAEAQATFARGAALRPRDHLAHVTWANFLLRHQHPAEAMAAYEKALTVAPDAPDVHYAYATALGTTGRYEDALREFRAALRLRPDYAEAHNNLGNTLLALQQPQEAVSEYRLALQARPDDANTHNNLGLALAQTGRLSEAAEHFASALKLAPSFENARRNLEQARAQLQGP